MQRIAAEDVRHILWSSLPRPSCLAHLKRVQGEQSFPSFLLDLIGKSAQSKSLVAKRKPVRIPSDSRQGKNLQTCCEEKLLPEAGHNVDSCKLKDRHLEDVFYNLLQDCMNRKDLGAGREVHRCILEKGFHQNAYIACHLIKMFAMCGSLAEANHVFSSFLAPDSFTWSAIISAHAYLGQAKQAIKFFEQMMNANVQAGAHTYLAVLKACSSLIQVHKGRVVHTALVVDGCNMNGHVSSMLIIMYAMCGSIDDAWKVFNGLSKHDNVMYNVMMLAAIKYGNSCYALEIFNRLQRQADSISVVAPILGLKACLKLKDRDTGKVLHSLMTELGFELNPYACSALMAMYVTCGNLDDACSLFVRFPKKTAVIWSFMIEVFAELNDYPSAVKYFKQMQQEGISPNDVTYLSILSACSHSGLLYEGLSHFGAMRDEHGVVPMLAHYNCMIDLLARLGHVVEAEDLLQAMPFKPDAVGCTALLSHHRAHGNVAGGRTSLALSDDLDLLDVSVSLVMSEIYEDAGW